MNLAALLGSQTVQWEVGTQNTRGDRTYATAIPIAGRWVARIRDVIGNTGEVVTTMGVATLLVEPAVGDLLNGHEVVTIQPMTDYQGNVLGYQCSTR